MKTNSFRSSEENKNIKLALISTYPHLVEILSELAEREGIKLYNFHASFEAAAEEACKISSRVDAILSRGGTAEYVRRAVEIPVISIPITPFDVTDTVFQHNLRGRRIAFINYERRIDGIDDIEKMFDIEVAEYTFVNRQDIWEAVNDAKSRGIDTVIGGLLAVELADQLGLLGIEINSCRESVYESFYETIQLVKTQKEERNISERLRVAFDTLQEGVLITDEKRMITRINPAAEHLLGVKAGSLSGKKIDNALPATDYNNSFVNRNAVQNKLSSIGKSAVIINHAPVYLNADFIGVVSTIEDVTKIQNLENSIRKKLYSKGFLAKYNFEDILTLSPLMNRVKNLAAAYAQTMSSVLIEGESGTGKEMLAQSIHQSSQCAHGPFVAINCAAIPDQLLEAELFGYEPGAFTGARKDGKAGMFELAHGGTIFLDEIGEIPLSLQASLLRVVQEREVMRIGGDKLIPVNTRIISATNRNLREKAEKGEFRSDLYYRLSVFNLKLPPLRERREDIPVLADAFLENHGVSSGQQRALVKNTLGSLAGYGWPGNIRELQNILERACLLLTTSEGTIHDSVTLEDYLDIRTEQQKQQTPPGALTLRLDLQNGLKGAVADFEKEAIGQVLEQCGGDQQKAMELLMIGRSTLWRKLNAGGEEAGS